ncbi:MAG: ankyrin repeat protein, partial [Myxococcota bacterium]
MNLHLLIAEGDLDAVAEALAGGADVEARTATDATPLYAAMASRSLPMVELLLAHGADPNAIQENLSTWDRDQARIHRLEGDGDHATTARAKALGVASPRTVLSASVGVWGNVELVRRLLDAGARIDVADPRGWTPLHYAAHGRAHNDVLELLVGAGADLHARTSDGHTALALCCVEWRSTETRCL